jgi:hypothetical protein
MAFFLSPKVKIADSAKIGKFCITKCLAIYLAREAGGPKPAPPLSCLVWEKACFFTPNP